MASSNSLITAALIKSEESSSTTGILPLPEDPSFVYPLSAFPPLSAFDISMKYPAITAPARQISELRTKLKSVVLQRQKLKIVYPLSETDPLPTASTTTTPEKETAPTDPQQTRSKYRKLLLEDQPDIFENPELHDLLADKRCYCRGEHNVTVSYADWSVDEVLRRILPPSIKEVPSSFEMVGHVAHINLRDELLPYKFIIGKVLLHKNTPRIKTIVNKIGTIETEYRTFGMEVIAGYEKEGWSNVTVKEEGCQYFLDFRKVYWNSRLGGEHRRLVDVIRRDAKEKKDDTIVVADLMAGIGPFAIPLSSKSLAERQGFNDNILVHANDLNPSSFEYLLINKKKNKCEKNLKCYNMDAREFCHLLQEKGVDFHHVLMNLPATAPEFLDAFRGFSGKSLPRIHVHCFGPKEKESSEHELIERCESSLGCSLGVAENKVSVHTVRDIAPKKNMYCVSFNLPQAARDLPRIDIKKKLGIVEPEAKRAKLN